MKITKKEYKVLKGIIERYEAKNSPNTIAGVDFSEVVNCLHEVKVKPTIYDWSNEPEEVKFMCTDGYGGQERWELEPKFIGGSCWVNQHEDLYGSQGFLVNLSTPNSPFKGNFQNSLEARPK